MILRKDSNVQLQEKLSLEKSSKPGPKENLARYSPKPNRLIIILKIIRQSHKRER